MREMTNFNRNFLLHAIFNMIHNFSWGNRGKSGLQNGCVFWRGAPRRSLGARLDECNGELNGALLNESSPLVYEGWVSTIYVNTTSVSIELYGKYLTSFAAIDPYHWDTNSEKTGE